MNDLIYWASINKENLTIMFNKSWIFLCFITEFKFRTIFVSSFVKFSKFSSITSQFQFYSKVINIFFSLN